MPTMRTPGDAAGQPWTTGATTSAACATPQWDLSEERRVQQGFDRNQLSKFTYRSWGTDAPVDAGNKANVRRFFGPSASADN
jgi:hypothetical protein